MRRGGRTKAANRPASSQSRPPHELSNGHIGQRLSEVGRVSCRVKPSFQLALHVRLGISLTSNAVRLTAIRTPLRTDCQGPCPSCRPEAPVATTPLSRLSGTKQRLRADSPS